jgi:hypothetical protein
MPERMFTTARGCLPSLSLAAVLQELILATSLAPGTINFFSHVVHNWSPQQDGLSHGFSNSIAARDESKVGCTMVSNASRASNGPSAACWEAPDTA